VDGTYLEETIPQFLYSKFAQGKFSITCASKHSKVWLTRTHIISELGELQEGADLKVVDCKDPPKRRSVLVRVPDNSEVTTETTRPKIQNYELNTKEWSVMSRKVTEMEQTLDLSIEPDSFKTLARMNFKVFWGLGRIIFRALKNEKGEPKDENITTKSTSQ
jgi:hypothetical protein